jgi:hypothetical protein
MEPIVRIAFQKPEDQLFQFQGIFLFNSLGNKGMKY